MTQTIVAVRARLVRAALPRPWGADVPAVHVLPVEVECSDGVVGYGFSWTPTIGPRAVAALLEHDLGPAAIARSADPETTWDGLWAHVHEAGGGGLTTIALAGIDTALWDARGRREGRPLADLLGRRRDTVEAYGSGVNLHYPLPELEEQAHRWVAAGFGAVKMKVGSPDLDDDIRRVAAVRAILGPDRALRIDANQRWDLDRAVTAIRELAAFDLDWVEEPLRADDLGAHRLLRERVDATIALGENLHTTYRFDEVLAAGVCDVAQPNVIRVGGITPYLRIADRVAAAGARLAPHLLPDLSTQLALASPIEAPVEIVEDAAFGDLGILAGPSPIAAEHGRLRLAADPAPGLGLTFREDAA